MYLCEENTIECGNNAKSIQREKCLSGKTNPEMVLRRLLYNIQTVGCCKARKEDRPYDGCERNPGSYAEAYQEGQSKTEEEI
jgi:hypothetical protein